MRLVIARCSVDYVGRLTTHLPMATRLLLVKADGSARSTSSPSLVLASATVEAPAEPGPLIRA